MKTRKFFKAFNSKGRQIEVFIPSKEDDNEKIFSVVKTVVNRNREN